MIMGTTLLIILDGFGYREETTDNAIAAATTPHWDVADSNLSDCQCFKGLAVRTPI